ncbi:DNA circularization N-terminal domain-containing protein [Pseudomonas juntendi]|uniref:DNA circularization N-terminal domain-containing protein n=1 Tax=Pseudomonas juntendi TaxID=2666183 RepID=A0A7W2QA74_9PSED|nr:DNA circularization N-terminal domain-containing protein [Pseudomonas juntendi]MBA6098954.1 DNA circularization N-terminal domain-containing protein [Pseudomonas juntendi]
MSWEDDLLDCSYRGIPMEIMAEDLEAQRSLAQHGVPYKDGEDVEDLGRDARVFNMRAVVFGPNYLFELKLILGALDTIGPGELIHPIYGSVTVVSGGYKVSHRAERPDYAEVELRFLEKSETYTFFQRDLVWTETGSAYIEDERTWQDGVFDLIGRVDSLVAEVQGWIGGGWTGLMEKALGLPGITLRLQQMRSQILGVVSGVQSMAKSSGSAFDPITDLFRTPTEIRSSVEASTPSTAADLLSRTGMPSSMPGGDGLPVSVAKVGAAFLVAARQGDEPSDEGLPSSIPTDPVEATAFALVVLVVTEMALNYASAISVAIENDAEDLTLSPSELERLANLARSLLQAAILLHRRLYGVEDALPVIEGLRTTAALIQARARQLVLQRPPLITRSIESATSLRLLAHRWYGDNSRAAELLRLNPELRSPYNLPPGTVIQAYAN